MEGDVSVMDPWGPECLLLALGEGKGRLAYQPVVCAVSYETVCCIISDR